MMARILGLVGMIDDMIKRCSLGIIRMITVDAKNLVAVEGRCNPISLITAIERGELRRSSMKSLREQAQFLSSQCRCLVLPEPVVPVNHH
jgi:methylmalonyl-CoA mutase